MRVVRRVVCLVSVAGLAYVFGAGCSPESGASDGGGTGGTNAQTGGSAGMPGGGSTAGGASGMVGAGGESGAGGSGGQIGAGGTGGGASGGYSTHLGVDPNTVLQDLPDESLIHACQRFDVYLRSIVPDADVIRGFCVVDAVYVQSAATVESCHQLSQQCIAALPPTIAPLACSGKGDMFECTATVALFEQCATDFAEAKRREFVLLVCESIEDPAIEQKLAEARAVPESCATFEAQCPGFFPTPPPPEM